MKEQQLDNKTERMPLWKEFCQDPMLEQSLWEYEQTVESLESIEDVRETQFYKNTLAAFNIPKNISILERNAQGHLHFDEDLLLRLIFASHTSTFDLSISEEGKKDGKILIDVEITAQNDDQKVTRKLSELSAETIYKVYKIYLNEQLYTAADEELKEEMQHYIPKMAELCNAWLKELIEGEEALLDLENSDGEA